MQNKLKPSKLEKFIYQIFTENTGSSLGDSGGYAKYDEEGNYIGSEQGYGRKWERNKNRPIESFINQPTYTFEINKNWINKSISTWHWFTYNYELDDICMKFNKKKLHDLDKKIEGEWEDDGILYKFMEKYNLDDLTLGTWNNTCNHDSDLDYTLVFANIGDVDREGISYTIFRLHLGCDIRGGYGQYFMLKNNDYYHPFDYIEECEVNDYMSYREGVEVYIDIEGYGMPSIKLTEKEINKYIELSDLGVDLPLIYEYFVNYDDFIHTPEFTEIVEKINTYQFSKLPQLNIFENASI